MLKLIFLPSILSFSISVFAQQSDSAKDKCLQNNGHISSREIKGCNYEFCSVYDGKSIATHPVNNLPCMTKQGVDKALKNSQKEIEAYRAKRESIMVKRAPLDHNLDGVVDEKDDFNGDGVVDLKDARSGNGNGSKPDKNGVIGWRCHSKSGICAPNYDLSTNLEHTRCPEYLDIYLLTGSDCLKECQPQIAKVGEVRESIPKACAKCLGKYEIVPDEHYKLSIVDGMVSIKRACLLSQVNENEGNDFDRRNGSTTGKSGGGSSGGSNTQQQ